MRMKKSFILSLISFFAITLSSCDLLNFGGDPQSSNATSSSKETTSSSSQKESSSSGTSSSSSSSQTSSSEAGPQKKTPRLSNIVVTDESYKETTSFKPNSKYLLELRFNDIENVYKITKVTINGEAMGYSSFGISYEDDEASFHKDMFAPSENGNYQFYINSFTYSTLDNRTYKTVTLSQDNIFSINVNLNQFTVTLNPNGGVLAQNVYTYDEGASLRNLPIPTYNGYKFLGWYDSDGVIIDNKPYFNGIDRDLYLTAEWEVVNYKLTFYKSMEQAKINGDVPATYNILQSISLPTAEAYGYRFLGWKIDNSGSPITVLNGNEITRLRDLNLYASWEALPVTLVLDYQIPGVENKSISLHFGDRQLLSTVPENPGYNFKHWVDKDNNTYTLGSYYTVTSEDRVQTLTAVWEGRAYTIFLSSGIYQMELEPIQVKFGEPFVLPTLESDGQVFLGWVLDTYYNGTNRILEVVKSGTYSYPYSIPLTGKWTDPHSYESIAYEAIDDKTCQIFAKDNNSLGFIRMPSIMDGLLVTKIKTEGFKDCTSLNNFDAQSGYIVDVGNSAFAGCTNLNYFYPGRSSLKRIGSHAFDSCSNLYNANLQCPLEEIGSFAFKNCSHLGLVDLSPANNFDPNYPKIECIKEGVFENCSSLVSFTFPATVTNIERDAFKNCTSLENVNFTNSIKSIGEESFKNCSSLKDIILNENLEYVFLSAFEGCTSAQKVLIFSSLRLMSSNAFNDCGDVIIYCEAQSKPEGWNDDWNGDSLNVVWGGIRQSDNFLFIVDNENNATILKFKNSGNTLRIPSTIDTFKVKECVSSAIVTSEAYSNKTLEVLSIAEGVCCDKFEQISFAMFHNLKQVTIPSGTTVISERQFDSCSSLKDVEYFDSVTTILDNAFLSCSSLESFFIGKNIEFLSRNNSGGTFQHATKLSNFVVHQDNQFFMSPDGSGMLYNKDGTTLRAVGGGVSGDVIVLPNTTKIGNYAFYGCRKITSVDLRNVEDIGIYSFHSSEITKFLFTSSLRTIRNMAFGTNSKLESIEIPEGVTTIEQMAFWACHNLKEVVLPSSLTSLGNDLFRDTNQNINVFYKGNETSWNALNTNNTYESNISIYFYSESEPAGEGNYWHYVNDKPVAW